MRIERREADHCRAQHRLRKVEAVDAGCEVVALLRDRKDQRDVVQLVAPRVQIDRRIEDPIRPVEHDASRLDVMGDPEAGRKAKLVRVQ